MDMRRLGPHLIGGTSVGLGHPWGVKAVNVSWQYVAQLRRELGPLCLVYVRFEHDDPTNEMLYWPEEAARDWFARRLPDMDAIRRASGVQTVFELPPNEPSTAVLPMVVRFYRVLLPLAYGHGFRVAVGNASVGEWHEDAWPQFKPILDMLHPGSVLSLHEYWRRPADLSDRWLTARWTQPQIEAVIGDTPIIVSELGRDVYDGFGGPWLDAGISEEQYLAELQAYAALMAQSPQVYGGFVFTLDSADPRWRRYAVDTIWPQVVAGYVAPTSAPRPQDETATDPATIAEKVRWWQEEAVRQLEAAGVDRGSRAMQIMYGLVNLDDGLLYRLERTLKEA